jgi:hypothetical protein
VTELDVAHFTIDPGTVICLRGDINADQLVKIIENLKHAAGHDRFILLTEDPNVPGDAYLHTAPEILQAIKEALIRPKSSNLDNTQISAGDLAIPLPDEPEPPKKCAYCELAWNAWAIVNPPGSAIQMNGVQLRNGNICPNCANFISQTGREPDPQMIALGRELARRTGVTIGNAGVVTEPSPGWSQSLGPRCFCGGPADGCPGISHPNCGIYRSTPG